MAARHLWDMEPLGANKSESRCAHPGCASGATHDGGGETRASMLGRNWQGTWRKTPGRLFGTGFVRLYQLTLSGFVGNTCRHLPTCSEYAYEAIARHGLWAGGWIGAFRVARCGPFGTQGIDRVPEQLDPRYRWFTPWRYWRIGAHAR